MPPLPSWETMAYGPSVVPGERVMDAGGDHISEQLDRLMDIVRKLENGPD